MRRNIQQRLFKAINLIPQISSQLIQRKRDTLLSFPLYQVHYCLCLRQINSSIHKCSFCKFPLLSMSSTVFKNQFQHLLSNKLSTMTINLNNIFTSICFRCLHSHNHRFIYYFFSIVNKSIIKLIKTQIFIWVFRLKYFI